jgi:phosphoglycolate phosphatase
MPAPRLVILDFDGTLVDSWPWFRGQIAETARRFGHAPITGEEAESFRALPPREVRRLGIAPWQVPRIAAHLKRAAAEAPPPPLFPGMAELLQRLDSAGIALALATSNRGRQVARSLGPRLDALIAHRAVEASLFGKAARFRRLLRDSGRRAAEALAIGDEARDIEAARAAGIAIGAVTWGYGTPGLLAACAPDALFTTPAEIAAYCGA